MCSLAAAPSAGAGAAVVSRAPQQTSLMPEHTAADLEGGGGRQRLSMSPSHTKGLLNAPGQNNCFLNSAVQVLWHLDVFRRSFRHLVGHACMASSCIFCALKAIFKQFQSSDKSALPPDGLRQALARTFADQQRFQLGIMDDAAECFENILLRIHTHVAPSHDVDNCHAPHCIPHRKFTVAITEKVNCLVCGAASEPFSYDEMVYYVSTTALVKEATAEYASRGSWGNFAELLRQTVCKGDARPCPGGCGASCDKQRILRNSPDVVSIGLVWDSDKSHIDHIQDTMYCIGTTLHLNKLFHPASTLDGMSPTSPSTGGNKQLSLVGIVCYYGMHYSTYFFHSKIKEWIYFDDAMVQQVSDSWESIVDRICRGHHQPLLLLYMNPECAPVSSEMAPKNITMVPGYRWTDGVANSEASRASKLARPLSLANSGCGLPSTDERSRSPVHAGYGCAPIRSSLDQGLSSHYNAGRPRAPPPTVAGRSASISSTASTTLEEAIFEYDTQSSVVSDSASLFGSDCMSVGSQYNPERDQARIHNSGRSSVPPFWAPSSRPSSVTAGGRRSVYSAAIAEVERLEPPAQFANPSSSMCQSLASREVQRSSSNASVVSREPDCSGRLPSKHAVGATTGEASIPGASEIGAPHEKPHLGSPVYIKPALLYGMAASSERAPSSNDMHERYINPRRVEAILSQQLRLSKPLLQQQHQHHAIARDSAERHPRMLRPSRDVAMASDALAAASHYAAVDAAVAESTSLASSTNDSGYRSAGSTSSACGEGGGSGSSWSAGAYSPSDLSLLGSPLAPAAQFDFASSGGSNAMCRGTGRPAQLGGSSAVAALSAAQIQLSSVVGALPVSSAASGSVVSDATSSRIRQGQQNSVVPQAGCTLRDVKSLHSGGVLAVPEGAQNSRDAKPLSDPAGSEDEQSSYGSLCALAEDLLTRAQALESSSCDTNLSAALLHYQNAIDALKKAMSVKSNDGSALTYAQQKHDACLIQSESIHRKMAVVRQEHAEEQAVTSLGQSSEMRISLPAANQTRTACSSDLGVTTVDVKRGEPTMPVATQAPAFISVHRHAAGTIASKAQMGCLKPVGCSGGAGRAPKADEGLVAATGPVASSNGDSCPDSRFEMSHASGMVRASPEVRRLRQPTAHSAVPQSDRTGVLKSIRPGSAGASPRSTPCALPRPGGGEAQEAQKAYGSQQLQQPRCSSASSSLSSSSSVGCSPRGVAHAKAAYESSARRQRMSTASAEHRLSPPAVRLSQPGDTKMQPAPSQGSAASPQLTRHGIRQLLVEDMRKRMQERHVEPSAARSGSPAETAAALPNRLLSPPLQYGRSSTRYASDARGTDTGTLGASNNSATKDGQCKGVTTVVPAVLSSRIADNSRIDQRLRPPQSAIPAPASVISRTKVVKDLGLQPPLSSPAMSSRLGGVRGTTPLAGRPLQGRLAQNT